MDTGFLPVALTGGVAGAFIAFGLSRLHDVARTCLLSATVQMEEDLEGLGRVRVVNNGLRAIERAFAFITLQYNPAEDVIDVQGKTAFISSNHRVPLSDDRLCWAVATPATRNPPVVDICPGERQGLDIAQIGPNWIEIPSEQGWSDGTQDRKSRVLLRKRKYFGKVSILAANTLRRDFELSIDPEDQVHPVKTRPMATTFGGRLSLMYRKTWKCWVDAFIGRPPLPR